MTEVGVKALKDHLSRFLERARAGERIVVTDRGKPVALLSPVEESSASRAGWELVSRGVASWAGGKPKGLRDRPQVKGKSAAEMVLEDRR
jgi:prevent-host-death family protein